MSITFRHVSNSILWGKVSYYPLGGILKGLNIAIGPTVGYTYSSNEEQATRRTLFPGETVRSSILSFNNGLYPGYRVSAGYEIGLGKKLLTGFRLDFSNNTVGDINTLAGLKLGIRF